MLTDRKEDCKEEFGQVGRKESCRHFAVAIMSGGFSNNKPRQTPFDMDNHRSLALTAILGITAGATITLWAHRYLASSGLEAKKKPQRTMEIVSGVPGLIGS